MRTENIPWSFVVSGNLCDEQQIKFSLPTPRYTLHYSVDFMLMKKIVLNYLFIFTYMT